MSLFEKLSKPELIELTKHLLGERNALRNVLDHNWDDAFTSPSDVWMKEHHELVDAYNVERNCVCRILTRVKNGV